MTKNNYSNKYSFKLQIGSSKITMKSSIKPNPIKILKNFINITLSELSISFTKNTLSLPLNHSQNNNKIKLNNLNMTFTSQTLFFVKENTLFLITHQTINYLNLSKEMDLEKLTTITMFLLLIPNLLMKIKTIFNLLPIIMFMEYGNINSLILQPILKPKNLPFQPLLISSKSMEIPILKYLYLSTLISTITELKISFIINTICSKVLMMTKVNASNKKEWLPKLLSRMVMGFKSSEITWGLRCNFFIHIQGWRNI